jgi:hypothetical protein
MLKLLSAEYGRVGTLRKYLHYRAGEIIVTTMWGVGGAADVIYLDRPTRMLFAGGERRKPRGGTPWLPRRQANGRQP